MADADDLWTAVEARYPAAGLLQLTNPEAREAVAVDATVGTQAAQSVIDIWPVYAQAAYDGTSATHLEVASFGVIALLWRRGATSTSIAKVEWDEVFGPEGMVAKVRQTGARGHVGPSSNSGVSTSPETVNGRSVQGWSDRGSLPFGLLPEQRAAGGD